MDDAPGERGPGADVRLMQEFFDAEAAEYDAFTRRHDRVGFYSRLQDGFERTDEAVTILDLGIGTGLELDEILKVVPNARITGIDVSGGMLQQLYRKHKPILERLTLTQGSFLHTVFPNDTYDYVLAVATMHHFLHGTRSSLYRRIRQALRVGGRYIEADKFVSARAERATLIEYLNRRRSIVDPDQLYHIDVPCSTETQMRLMRGAGFRDVRMVRHEPGSQTAMVFGTR